MSMTAPLPEHLLMRLGAYVDGALSAEESAEVEALIATEPVVAAEIEALLGLNDDLKAAFDPLLEAPAAELDTPQAAPQTPPAPAPAPAPANSNRAPGMALAAMLALGMFLGGGATWFYAAQNPPAPVQVAAKRSWLGEVAEYHQVYARQKRHLVEVPASEKSHIEKWLSKEIGVAFRVPDLSAAGWEFQGGRLLVAAGKPVAQLLYQDAQGQVIALCALRNGSGTAADITRKEFGDLNMAVWKSTEGSFAIVGEASTDLPALAQIAAPLI